MKSIVQVCVIMIASFALTACGGGGNGGGGGGIDWRHDFTHVRGYVAWDGTTMNIGVDTPQTPTSLLASDLPLRLSFQGSAWGAIGGDVKAERGEVQIGIVANGPQRVMSVSFDFPGTRLDPDTDVRRVLNRVSWDEVTGRGRFLGNPVSGVYGVELYKNNLGQDVKAAYLADRELPSSR